MYSNRHSARKNDLYELAHIHKLLSNTIHVFAFIPDGMGDEKTFVVIWKIKRLKSECLQRFLMYLNVVGCNTANDLNSHPPENTRLNYLGT